MKRWQTLLMLGGLLCLGCEPTRPEPPPAPAVTPTPPPAGLESDPGQPRSERPQEP